MEDSEKLSNEISDGEPANPNIPQDAKKKLSLLRQSAKLVGASLTVGAVSAIGFKLFTGDTGWAAATGVANGGLALNIWYRPLIGKPMSDAHHQQVLEDIRNSVSL